jgi:hypothetical protein
MVPAFEEAAYALEVGEISDPVETGFGWHILESLGKGDIMLDPNSFEQLKNQTFTNWLNELKSQYDPVINPDWVNYVPSEPSLPAEYISYIQQLTTMQPQLPPEIPQE